jgi:NAD-dependent dihydropyrimidine dehydrogenase PreA subunit
LKICLKGSEEMNMNNQTIDVDRKKCNGCNICVEICPLDCLRLDEDNKAYMKYDECWYCGSCEIECPEKAIKMRLPYLVS